jgi:hypothetical protein
MYNNLPTLDIYLPVLDTFPEAERIQKIKEAEIAEAEAFINTHPEFYAIEENSIALQLWLFQHELAPVTLRNLEIAFRDLCKKGKIIERPAEEVENTPEDSAQQFVSRIVRRPLNQAELQLARENQTIRSEEEASLRAKYPVNSGVAGKKAGVDAGLRREYLNSLSERKAQSDGYPENWTQAQAIVGFYRDDLKRGSQAFNQECTRLLAHPDEFERRVHEMEQIAGRRGIVR